MYNFPDWLQEEYNWTVATFIDKGIYAINGPNWEQDLDKICSIYKLAICLFYKEGRATTEPVSVKAEQYWIQNGIVNEFNEWQPNWLSGDYSSDPVDVSKIADVPMSFMIAANDSVCPAEVAESYIEKMQTQTSIVEVSRVGHGYFSSNANTDWFMQHLLEELVY